MVNKVSCNKVVVTIQDLTWILQQDCRTLSQTFWDNAPYLGNSPLEVAAFDEKTLQYILTHKKIQSDDIIMQSMIMMLLWRLKQGYGRPTMF
jgi:hypothetical protein